MGTHSSSSWWWIPPCCYPGPRLNWDSALRPLSLVPPLAPCLQILFSFASHSTQLLSQANICLPGMLLFNALGKHEPSCWSLGPWANKQKRKMVPAVGWQGREKGGEAVDGEVCHWLSIWGNTTLLISPFILFPSCPALYPNPHTAVHQWARKGVVVAGKVSIPRVKGWSELFYVCSFHAGFRCSA